MNVTLTRAVLVDDQFGQSWWLPEGTNDLVAGGIDEQVDPDWVVAYWGDNRFDLPADAVELIDA